MTFGFIIRFFAPPGTLLRPEVFDLHLPGAKHGLVVKQHEPKPNALPIDPVVITIKGGGFENREAALTFGRQLRQSLAVHSVRTRRGFWLGDDRTTSSVGDSIRDRAMQEYGVEIRPTVHGLDVYEEVAPVRWVEMSARLSVIRQIDDLGSGLAADFRRWEFPAKLMLAIDLYNESHFIGHPETRFLSLVTVVEVLVDRPPVDGRAMAFLDECLELLSERSLDECHAQSLKSGIAGLKKQSIGSACIAAATQAGCDARLMRQCYRARSELLHSGESTSDPDLPRQPHLLDELVHRMIVHRLDDPQIGSAADFHIQPVV